MSKLASKLLKKDVRLPEPAGLPWYDLSYLSEDPEALGSWTVNLEQEETETTVWFPRASSLYKSCMRAAVLGTLNKITRRSKVGFNQKIIFGFGTAFHEWLQNDPTIFGGKRRGFWICTACRKKSEFGPFPTKRCKCGAAKSAYRYEEAEMQGKACTGHPDMFLEHDGLIYVTEFKTINQADFERLSAPLIEHRWQVAIYSNFFVRAYKEVTGEEALVYYFSKQTSADSFPVKAFMYSPTEDVLEEISGKLYSYVRGIETKGQELPDLHDECKNDPKCYRARSCPCLNLCAS